MPAPVLYSNIILILGSRDLGLCPLICCVTGSVLPGTYPGQQKHTTGRKRKVPQMGKQRDHSRADTSLWLRKNQIWDGASSFCSVFVLSWEKTGITALPRVDDNCCTPRADTSETLPSFLAVELWQGVGGEKGWVANLVLWNMATNTYTQGGREKWVPLSPTSSHPTNTARGHFSLGVPENYKSDQHLHMTLRMSTEIYPAVLIPPHFINFKPATGVSPNWSTQNIRI